MTIPPGAPTVTVEHGPGFLHLAITDDRPPVRCNHCHRPPSLGTVLSPDAADQLAYELSTQAAQARQAMTRIHPPR